MKIQANDIEIVDINSLIPHPKNPHRHTKEQIERLCKLIEYQGFRNPVVCQRGTNIIVCGHGRVEAAKKIGMRQLPVIFQEFDSEAQLYAYVVSDNSIGKDSWASLDLSQINKDFLDLGPELDIEMLGLKEFSLDAQFEPSSANEQGKLDELAPKYFLCPNCGEKVDLREYGY